MSYKIVFKSNILITISNFLIKKKNMVSYSSSTMCLVILLSCQTGIAGLDRLGPDLQLINIFYKEQKLIAHIVQYKPNADFDVISNFYFEINAKGEMIPSKEIKGTGSADLPVNTICDISVPPKAEIRAMRLTKEDSESVEKFFAPYWEKKSATIARNEHQKLGNACYAQLGTFEKPEIFRSDLKTKQFQWSRLPSFNGILYKGDEEFFSGIKFLFETSDSVWFSILAGNDYIQIAGVYNFNWKTKETLSAVDFLKNDKLKNISYFFGHDDWVITGKDDEILIFKARKLIKTYKINQSPRSIKDVIITSKS